MAMEEVEEVEADMTVLIVGLLEEVSELPHTLHLKSTHTACNNGLH